MTESISTNRIKIGCVQLLFYCLLLLANAEQLLIFFVVVLLSSYCRQSRFNKYISSWRGNQCELSIARNAHTTFILVYLFVYGVYSSSAGQNSIECGFFLVLHFLPTDNNLNCYVLHWHSFYAFIHIIPLCIF